jgi:hypothetical protein
MDGDVARRLPPTPVPNWLIWADRRLRQADSQTRIVGVTG